MELFRGYSRYKCRLVSVISRAATPIPTRRRNVDMPHRRASGLRESFSRGRTVRRGSTSRRWAPARISAGYPIEKMIKMKLGALGIAAFAALNQSLGLVYCRTLEIPQPVPRQMDQNSRAWGAEFSARARRLHKNSFQRPRWRQRGRRPGTFIDHERKESQQHLSL